MNTPLQASWVRSSLLYVVSLALIGCMRQSTQRVEPAGSVNQPTTHIDSANRLVSHPLDIYQPGIAQYDYQSISTIQLMANDSTSRIDSSRITAVLTTTFAPAFGRQTAEATVKADSILIVTQPLSTSPSSVQTQFIPLKIDRVTGKFLSPTPTAAQCNQATVDFIFRGDEVIPAIRHSSASSQSWTDTTVLKICRGGMRIQSTRVSRYRVDSSSLSAPLTTRLIRTTDVHMSGTGSQWQQPVQVSGEGTSTDTLVIAGAPPRLQQMSGTSQLSLDFKSPVRTQQFIQRSTASITKRTP